MSQEAAAVPSERKVNELSDKESFKNDIEDGKGLAVLDCYATWCGPCKIIAPQIAKFAIKYPNTEFYKLDVDAVPDIAQELAIRAMPTFIFFKDGKKVKDVVGANPKAIEAAIVELGGKPKADE